MIYKIKESLCRRGLLFKPQKRDALIYLQAVVIVVLLGRLFYDSWIAVAILTPLMLPYIAQEVRRKRKKETTELGIRFKDAILSVAASQRAGYSVENAFLEARHDIALLYGKESDIHIALCNIAKALANGRTMEEALDMFAATTDHPDIREFADVFKIAKRSGGNMVQVIDDTASLIADKVEAERQIDVLISAKRLESRLMEIVPFFIIMYVGGTNKGFFTPLYHNAAGIAVMTVSLAVYAAAYVMIERIVEIEV